MIINVHAGHNPHGCVACGCVGYLSESTENRKVKDLLINSLQNAGNIVYDCTVNNGKSQGDVLNKIIAKCNAHDVDLDLSIHFNASNNPEAQGVECWIYSAESKAKKFAEKICDRISINCDIKNRGVKYSTKLAVLRRTKAPAIIIECCFLTNLHDVEHYMSSDIAAGIYQALQGKDIDLEYDDCIKVPVKEEEDVVTGDEGNGSMKWYRVQVGAFKSTQNAERLKKELEAKGYTAIITE